MYAYVQQFRVKSNLCQLFIKVCAMHIFPLSADLQKFFLLTQAH